MTYINNSLLLSLVRRVGHLSESFRDKAAPHKHGTLGRCGGYAGGLVFSLVSDNLIIDSPQESKMHLCSHRAHHFIKKLSRLTGGRLCWASGDQELSSSRGTLSPASLFYFILFFPLAPNPSPFPRFLLY